MIKENQRMLNSLNILSDGMMPVIAMLLAYALRFCVFEGELGHLTLVTYLQISLATIPLLLFTYACFGLYESFRSASFLTEFSLIFRSNLICLIVLLTAFFAFKNIDVSRWTMILFMGFCLTLTAAKRFTLRYTLHRYREMGYNIKHVFLIGGGATAWEYLNAIRENRNLGFSVDEYVAGNDAFSDDEVAPIYRGSFDKLPTLLANCTFDEVVVALDATESHLLPDIIHMCEKSGVKLCVIPFYFRYMPSRPSIDEIGQVQLINIRSIPLDNFLNAFLKRTTDILGSLILIVLSSPFMLIACVGTKLSSPGPVIFKQERIGLNKKPFVMYKFRSMRINDASATAWSRDEDARKTKFGSFLRKLSIDELPQFFNVLKGDMSLVGPRPEIRHFVAQFKETIPLYMVKHQVRPGITGWAQVNGYRGDTSIEKRIQHDIYYIENWTWFMDVRILIMTLFKGFVNTEKLNLKG